MADKDIVITYETLFDILRREKSRLELQKLERSFFADVVGYLKDKDKILSNDSQDDLFSAEEREKARKQVYNIKRILKELYDRREKKVLAMAVDKAKTGSKLMDTGALLPQEKQLFDSAINVLLLFRNEIIQNLINAKEVKDSITDAENYFDKKRREEEEGRWGEIFRKVTPDDEDTVGDFIPADNLKQETGSSEKTSDTNLTTLRFLQPVPKFVGLELEEYGPFEPDDMANIPEILAKVLIEKKRAEIVSDA